MSGRTSNASTRTTCPTTSSASTTRPAEPKLTTAKLRVSLDSGETLALDIPGQLGEWDRLKTDPSFQAQIRGVVFVFNGRSHSLAAPRGFRRVLYNVELVPGQDQGVGANVPPTAVRASYVADAIQATMTLYLKDLPPMVRFDVKVTGKLRWQAP